MPPFLIDVEDFGSLGWNFDGIEVGASGRSEHGDVVS